MASITPIKATFHYDDVGQTWEMKISREVVDNTGAYVEKPIIEKAQSFLQLLTILYQLWAMFSQGAAADKRNSPAEDLEAFTAWLGTATAHTVQIVTTPEGVDVPDPPDLDDYDPYTGGDDDWGATEP